MRLYIAGPCAGYEDFNYPAFYEAAVELHRSGYGTLNPARHGQGGAKPWTEFMRLGLGDVLAADGVAQLPKWYASRGATLETFVATQLGLPVFPVLDWIKRGEVVAWPTNGA